jgi:imidazolonepropionase-like amidohydrolase
MIEHPLPRTDAVIRMMAERGVEADPTIVPYQIIFDLSGGYYGSTSRRFTLNQAANLAMLRRLKDGGVKMGIGTDLVANWFRYLPWPYLEEMRHFVSVGFTVPEVLSIATKGNAEMLDMGDKLGTIAPGKLADVIVIDGRPDERLDDLANVALVIRDGRVQVESGRVVYERHVPLPPPSKR